MNILIVLICFVLADEAKCSCGSTFNKIINGEIASSWPWMVSLQYSNTDQNSHFCGGSIISDQYVVTAAHCVFSNRTFFVKAGTNNLLEPNQNVFEISKIFYNNYFWVLNQNDIAIIKLKEKISLTNKISPICLPNSTQESLVFDKKVVTIGWGHTDPNIPSVSDILYQASIQIFSNSEVCFFNSSTHYCAYDPSSKESGVCYGDSGSPLMYSIDGKWYIFGITSMGSTSPEGKCLGNQSSYFTRVPKYANWINQILETVDETESTTFEIEKTTNNDLSSASQTSTLKNMSINTISIEKIISISILIFINFI